MVAGGELVNSTELWNGLETIVSTQLSPLVSIFKVVGIAILIYLIFLIIRALFRWRTMNKIVDISKNVEKINEKLDVLIKEITKEKDKKEAKDKEEKERKKKK